MRQVSTILASWIAAASVGSIAVAGDPDVFSPPPAPPSEALQHGSLSAGGASGVSLTDPISTTPKSRAFDPFATEPMSGRTPGQGHSSFSVQQAPAKHPASHSDSHHAATGNSPFDEVTQSGHDTTQSKTSAWGTGSSASASGGLDASQAPTVCVQWVKRSPIVVGQECQCDLVVKNAGKTPARDLMVDAYFPVTVRLTHADPMPTDNTDHVTWSFAV